MFRFSKYLSSLSAINYNCTIPSITSDEKNTPSDDYQPFIMHYSSTPEDYEGTWIYKEFPYPEPYNNYSLTLYPGVPHTLTRSLIGRWAAIYPTTRNGSCFLYAYSQFVSVNLSIRVYWTSGTHSVEAPPYHYGRVSGLPDGAQFITLPDALFTQYSQFDFCWTVAKVNSTDMSVMPSLIINGTKYSLPANLLPYTTSLSYKDTKPTLGLMQLYDDYTDGALKQPWFALRGVL